MMKNFVIAFWIATLSIGSANAQNTVLKDKNKQAYLLAQGDKENAPVFLKSTFIEAQTNRFVAEISMKQTYVNRGNVPSGLAYIFPAVPYRDITQLSWTSKSDKKIIPEKQIKLWKMMQADAIDLKVPLQELLPGEQIEIEIRYTEMLTKNKDVYIFNFPNVPFPSYVPLPKEKTGQWVANPYLKKETQESNTIVAPSPSLNLMLTLKDDYAIEEIACPSHTTSKIEYTGAKSAQITLNQPRMEAKSFLLQFKLKEEKTSAPPLYRGAVSKFANNDIKKVNKTDIVSTDKDQKVTVLPKTLQKPLIEENLNAVNKSNKTLKHNLKKEDIKVMKVIHKVQEGHYLYRLSKKYGVEIEDIRQWNKLESDELKLEQTLIIYAKYTKEIHTVVADESLYEIAQMFGVKIEDLKNWNQLKDNQLEIGQKLLVYVLQSRVK